jgi:diacylglycerol kinase (ATP)
VSAMPDSRDVRAVLFSNPHSGRARRWLFEVLEACRVHGVELLGTHFDLRAERVRSVLDEAEASGVRNVLVAGGDGTVSCLLTCLMGRNFTLGILPAGTSNDFARSLCLPLTPDGAVRVIARGCAAQVSVGIAGDRVFGHAAILGINSDFACRADRLRRYIGRLSYPVAAVEVFRRRKRFAATLSTEDGVREIAAYEIAFINASIYGGVLDFEVPNAPLTDQYLTAVAVQDLRMRVMLRGLLPTITRRQLVLEGVETFGFRTCRVETEYPMAVTVDGEMVERTPLSVRIMPASLRVYVTDQFQERERERAFGR